MPVSPNLPQVETVERLTTIWANRYFPDLSGLLINNEFAVRSKLREVVSKQGRKQTAEKLSKKVIAQQCNLAAVRARALYSDDKASNFKEISNLAKLISRIYLKLIEIYQESAPVVLSQGTQDSALIEPSLESWGIPKINRLAAALAPLLSELQDQNKSSQSWQSAGFATTQINLSNALLLEQLGPVEQVFIKCYFQFLEEQVALPWQQMCAAAVAYTSRSSAFATVERILPMTHDIAVATYTRWSKTFQNYHSRRGALSSPAIKHSCIRDFEMFQVYLWLSFLAKDLKFVKQELSAICVMVFGALNIPWTMTVDGNILLMREILSRLEPHEKNLVRPYTQHMINAFSDK
ncbi:MAG: hypothetical protein AAF243_00960 [Cyanobacteria bacterium P01_A01_bin.137]